MSRVLNKKKIGDYFMFKVPLPEIKGKIVQSGKMSLSDLDIKIKEKINDLSGLISEEGAAHIIANELGIELLTMGKEKIKIKEAYPGMRNVSVVGKGAYSKKGTTS